MPSLNKHSISVAVSMDNHTARATSDVDEFLLATDSDLSPNERRSEFALWLFLPIAMRTGADLRIRSEGSRNAAINAEEISRIWEAWMPGRFSSVAVTFDQWAKANPRAADRPSLCLYSGGVDSTYTVESLHQDNPDICLLTVQGMDYKIGDQARFDEFEGKTAEYVERRAARRLVLQSNAYAVYARYGINMAGSHLTHIFALAGAGFAFSERFSSLTIAADHRTDQQFAIHPWGSNSATNPLFSDGDMHLLTHGDNVTRSEKVAAISDSPTALKALTFCTDYRYRPHNCGVCSKCMRTKLMFMAAAGCLPDIFNDRTLNAKALAAIDLSKRNERAFFSDLFHCAQKNRRLGEMPYLADAFVDFKARAAIKPKAPPVARVKKYLRRKARNARAG